MIELIGLMMQQFLLDVILNMLFDLILTQKLIIFCILLKFSLSIKELNSLTYLVYFKINLLSLSIYFENKESPIICYKYNKPICSTVLYYNK